MYDLIDRAVRDLRTPDRLVLDAMRAWVHSLTLAGEPKRAVAGRFIDGGSSFDAAMSILDRYSADTLSFQRPCHPQVEEIEAVLLGLWRLVIDGREREATQTAALLVDADAARDLVRAIRNIPPPRGTLH
ncbi:hypothetical protein [Sphingomonas sp. Mn802worker]|uniref:hypothetical protein n=1 Tax=Sphingomonas sp. Mn802worker TaxID=629773 RepID=UPI000377903D|nr:hypothetical protein [Sphingomonas sp. Mn802worker]